MFWKQSPSTDVVKAETIHEGNGAIKTRRLFEGVSRLGISLAVWELDPGVSEGSHTHEAERPLEEVYYFMEGSGVMWVDGEDVPVAAGDAVLVPPGADHGFRNTGDGPLKLVLLWRAPRD